MKVDVHTHLWEYPGHVSEYWKLESQRVLGDELDINIEPSKHLADTADVDWAIVLGFDAKGVGVRVPNEYIAEHVLRANQRLIGFASVDPHDPESCSQLKYAVRELNLKGVKLAPLYQDFDPGSSACYVLMKTIESLQVPTLWHMGWAVNSNVPLRYGMPHLLDELAYSFPRVKIVVAHMGAPFVSETLALIRKHTNVYSDISDICRHTWMFYNALVAVCEAGVSDRLLLGSDYPLDKPASVIEMLRSINGVAEGTRMPRVPDKVIEGIIERDALSLLDIVP